MHQRFGSGNRVDKSRFAAHSSEKTKGVRRSLVFKNGVLQDSTVQHTDGQDSPSADQIQDDAILYQSIQPSRETRSFMNNLSDTPYDVSSQMNRSIPMMQSLQPLNNKKLGNSSVHSFKEKEKRRDIDHKNKLLLG